MKKTVIKNPYFKVTVKDKETGDEEVSNRVKNVEQFKKQYEGHDVEITDEKLSDEEFEETDK